MIGLNYKLLKYLFDFSQLKRIIVEMIQCIINIL